MGKTAIKAPRGKTSFRLDPNDPRLRLIGHDTNHKDGEHICYQERAHLPVDEEFAQYMAVHGCTSVLIVFRDGDFLDIVVGRRRLKAARRANEIRAERGLDPIRIEVQVFDGTPLEVLALMITENSRRLEPHAIQMALDLNRFLRLGATLTEAAFTIGKSEQTVTNYISLLRLSTPVQEAVARGDLAVSAAIELLSLTRDEQTVELVSLLAKGERPTAANVNAAVRTKKSGEAVSPAPKTRTLRKLIAAEGAEEVLGENGIALIRFVLGELPARNIKGLTELLRKVESKKA
jgi:ParB family transcriptional regulator, chromosome partitioning protein